MKNRILDEGSAAVIMGVDTATVVGWCKNKIINCQNAPDEYADKAKYLIDEDECDYIGNLIRKFGTRMALLNYNKNWRGTTRREVEKEETKEELTKEKPKDIPKEQETSCEKTKEECTPTITDKDTNKLVSSIMYAHQIKDKIKQYKEELSKLEGEYNNITQIIISQL